MDKEQARYRATTWSEIDTAFVRNVLTSYEPISDSRWPYTYSADYVRVHLIDDARSSSRSEAAQATAQFATQLGVALDFLYCLFATMGLCGAITGGWSVMVAIATEPKVRELFEIVAALELDLSFDALNYPKEDSHGSTS